MAITRVTSRMLATSSAWPWSLAPAALLAVALAVTSPAEEQMPAIPELAASTETFAGIVTTMREDAPPPFDVVSALRALGRRWLVAPHDPRVTDLIPATAPCQRPTSKDRRSLRARLAGWVSATYPAYRDDGLDIRFGCIEDSGIVIAMNTDLYAKHDRGRESRWWALRVLERDVQVIAERRGTARIDYEEWADEGTIGVLALVDVDGDSANDVVWERTELEGGALVGSADVAVELSTSGRCEPVRGATYHREIELRGEALVFAIGDPDVYDGPVRHRCLSRDLKLHGCTAAALLDRRAARRAAAARLASVTATTLPTRDAAVADLTLLRVPTRERATILGALPGR